jgi:hypothetical protein
MKTRISLLVFISLAFFIFPQTEKDIKSAEGNNFVNQRQTYFFDVNRFRLPIANDGVIGDVTVNGQTGGLYDEGSVLFSGGFLLSGYKGNQFWANGVASASRVADYLPGIFDTSTSQYQNEIYIVTVNNPPFGSVWQNWVNAVNLGADFYDGNKDGLYNPIDLNNNGVWDANEDRPGLVGNTTVFFVYSDKKPSAQRRFTSMPPIGLEVRQTTYAFSNSQYSLNNVVFVKYNILNKSGADLDSVIFTAWADPDIGLNYSEDLVGTDTIRQTIFAYKQSSDPTYGSTPPAFLHSLMQGPVVYIPGETFIDLNNNGVYDHGVDTPIDTAYNVRGQVLGVDTLPGAKNMRITSSNHYMSSNIAWGDPASINEMRFLQLGGLTTLGQTVNPCNVGVVIGVNCNQVNRKFIYSGEPEGNIGWLHNLIHDQRTLLNVGPFKLKNNNSNTIVVAYVGGRGNSPKNSVTVGKQNLSSIREAYWKNFPVVLSVDSQNGELPTDFALYQNYPNPFNPATVIKWQSPVGSHTTLKVYDVLGREVATLVDEFREAGYHEVSVGSKQLAIGNSTASGVYFYRLQIGDFVQTKKMMFLK